MNDTPTAPEQSDTTEPAQPGARPLQAPQYAPPRYAPPQYTAPPATPPVVPEQAAQQPGYAQPDSPQYAAPQPRLQPEYMQQPAYMQSQSYPQSYPAPPYPVQNPYAVLPQPGPGEPFDGAEHAADLSRPLYGATFAQAWGRFFKNYAAFSGRASRSEFWWIILTVNAAWFVAAIFSGIMQDAFAYNYQAQAGMRGLETLFGLAFFVVLAGTFIPLLAVTWRRLHDADLPGAFYFLVLIPFFGAVALIVMLALPPKVSGRRYYRTL